MDRIPEFIPRLADDTRIRQIRKGEEVSTRLMALLNSRPEEDAQIGTIRRFVRRRKLRVAARDVLGEGSTEATLQGLTDTADAAVDGGLQVLMGEGTPGLRCHRHGKMGRPRTFIWFGSRCDVCVR